jgi:hypothetical protein
LTGEFLQCGRHNKSGILQRFIAPHGGGKHNSQIRAIWTPKLCILERRRTKQVLHDTRFALYERATTFDGPDVHSVSVPLRGTVLAGKVESICDEIARHITEVSADTTHGSKPNKGKDQDTSILGVGRMVVNFKVDGNGKVWILWSNSIRLQTTSVNNETRFAEVDTANASVDGVSSELLNMNTIVRLPSSIRLTQVPSHNTQVKLENKLVFASCPSCNNHGSNENFQSVPYNTVIQHFENTMDMLKSHQESHPSVKWPPANRFIRAAGAVGFGALSTQLAQETSSIGKESEETFVIPPVIRQVHPKLRIKGYTMYRNDPLFLHKTCQVCEDCFLAYANLTSLSFLITMPVKPFASKKELTYDFPAEHLNERNHKAAERAKTKTKERKSSGLEFKDFGSAPAMPPAILDVFDDVDDAKESPISMPECFPDSDDAKKQLSHLLTYRQEKQLMTSGSRNPYEEDLGKMLKS